MTGEPVASNRATVSRIAASYSGSRAGSSLRPPLAATAAISSGGRGMLPIGSVGIAMEKRERSIGRISAHTAQAIRP